jgi:hypothetical protein
MRSFLAQAGPAAGDLWPDETVHAAAVAELHFRRQTVEIDLVVRGAGRLPDREQTLHRLTLRRNAFFGYAQQHCSRGYA